MGSLESGENNNRSKCENFEIYYSKILKYSKRPVLMTMRSKEVDSIGSSKGDSLVAVFVLCIEKVSHLISSSVSQSIINLFG